jgi:hypothetical protein
MKFFAIMIFCLSSYRLPRFSPFPLWVGLDSFVG